MSATAAVLVVGLGAGLAACGSTPSASPSTGATTAAAVRPPADTVQGCTYAPGGKVPPGEPTGLTPPFGPVTPDGAARAALGHLAAHGGTGLVYGFQLPAGTELWAGPDASGAPVGTVPTGQSVLLLDPVLWTAAGGAHWLVTFLACGGAAPYWVDVAQIRRADAAVFTSTTTMITQLLGTHDYVTTHRPSSLPVVVDRAGRFAWQDPAVPFSPARGELVGFGA